MRKILYMATTINGFIATENHKKPWSDEEWLSYQNFIKQTGNLTIGRKTYELMNRDDFKALGNPFTIVLTKNRKIKGRNNIKTAETAKEALGILNKQKFTTVAIGGGSKLNASFINEKLVDEIIIDFEPILFGNGIPLFYNLNLEIKAELLSIKPLSQNCIQLHYKLNN